MLQVKPGAYLRLGQGAENGTGSCFLHNSRYDFNDDVLPLGAALHASLVEQGMPLTDLAHAPVARLISATSTPTRSDA
jgi:hippurate hydrolase